MEKESEKKAHNTAYIPTKCRITKPPPPKPATNPLQFVKVNPNPLFKSTTEKVKKVEEVKVSRQENIRDEAEDWQSNLDNWKSSRRKRQEHIIERLEEVKKLGQEGSERSRRKGTTFSEILEKRNKGSRPKFSIPLYENDSNDLSDYGIGSSSSKTNSIKDVDTDDNSSILDEKEHSYEENSNALGRDSHCNDDAHTSSSNRLEQIDNQKARYNRPVTSKVAKNNEQYTYEGAIQDYRSRIRTKININEISFEKLECAAKSKEFAEAQTLLPKGNLNERMKMFQTGGNSNDCQPSKQTPCEDLLNAQSIKERLQTLEKCTEQSSISSFSNKSDGFIGSMKAKLNSFDCASDSDAKNNNPTDCVQSEGFKESDVLLNNNAGYETYMEKLGKAAHLDSLYNKTDSDLNGYQPSASSSDLVTVSSDREDSGIHTTDVSCSVSQSDEPVEDGDISVPHECQNFKAITMNFLSAEQDFAAKTNFKFVPKAPIVKEASGQSNTTNFDTFFNYDNVKTNNQLDSISVILTSPVHPQLKPPSEKPPPPPINQDINDSRRLIKELHIKRSSFLGLDESPQDIYYENTFSQDPGINLNARNPTQEKSTNALPTTREEEIMQKEREIIELVEKEEKFKDHDKENGQQMNSFVTGFAPLTVNNIISTATNQPTDIYLGNKKFDEPYCPEPRFNDFDDQDSEVLKVEHELLQLEKEELKRQRENMLFQKKTAKFNKNCHLYDNIYYPDNHKNLDHRKSMPELQNLPTDYRLSQALPNRHINEGIKYQKSMPNIQQSYNTRSDFYNVPKYDLGIPFEHRKSMPNLEHASKSAFIATSSNNNLLLPIKPLKPIEKVDRFMCQNPLEIDRQSGRPFLRHTTNMHQKSARSKSVPKEAWIQPKANPQAKSYNQHWLYQEAELRRLSEQKHPIAHNRMLLDSKNVLDPTTKLIYNKSPKKSVPHESQPQKEYVNLPFIGRQQSYGHALPMPFPPHLATEEGHDVILSVSGKKKCSYCGKELGRGAAMIIESLSLFYHMECFKCCVCHMELGDGLMGTDVRVRNQKLHCHNCYSSDDGIKFSCV